MDKNAGIAITIIGLGLLALFIFTRPKPVERQPQEETIALRPRGSLARQYINEETWDIDWSEDGLPKRVTIHRNARES